ncbi:hypothetical protein BKA93DRAFT_752953 [Sparassis latifolia]
MSVPSSSLPAPRLTFSFCPHSHASDHDETDYLSRRMSSSATSDSSSLHSRPEKRPPSPAPSPLQKKLRPAVSLDPNPWSQPTTPSPQPSADNEDRSDVDPTRVQLPSLATAFQDRYDLRRASLPTLYSDSPAARLRLPQPAHRPSQSSSNLSAYQFPPPDAPDDARPRLAADTQLGLYPPSLPEYSSISSTGLSSTSASSFNFSPLSPDAARGSISGLSSTFSSDTDHWGSPIVRPNSTPGAPTQKYDDSVRHSSLGGPLSQQQFFGGVTRISGQHKHSLAQSAVKSESEWTFPSADNFPMPPASSTSYPSTPSSSMPAISVASSPSRSPQETNPAGPAMPAPGSLVERPPRKRGKLPKPVTDFLKDWLHRHSDHPYPSEEEKKQLCNATGLSMSQVSNWMINARRRILAPLHRPGVGPTTTTPFASRSTSLATTASLPPAAMLDSGRRASMPSDSLQLYYPMSLQPLHDPSQTRHMVGMSRSYSSSHTNAGLGGHGHGSSPYGLESGYTSSRLSYGGGALHPHAQLSHHSSHHASHSPNSHAYLGVPMSAPPLNSSPSSASFLGAQPHSQHSLYSQSTQSGSYMGSGQSHARGDERYSFSASSVSPAPQPGSGYASPQ